MARNLPRPLTEQGLATVCKWSHTLFLADATDSAVVVDYVKRDGSSGSAKGAILGFCGDANADTFSVIVDTVATKGRPTTINLALVSYVHLGA